ncbi:MAG: hypothetical protein IPI67_35730 [Myxococcales bacterium]|nr:hypothetical protein [Myxococcales bacterium]
MTHLSSTLVFVACLGTAAMSACGGNTDAGAPGSTGGIGGAGAGGTQAGTGGVAGSAGIAGDSGSLDSDNAAGADQGGPPVCEVCAHVSFVCSKPGIESVDFQVESQNSKGCAGHIVQFGGPTTEYVIDCELNQICGPGGCFPAALTASSFTWNGATCYATK